MLAFLRGELLLLGRPWATLSKFDLVSGISGDQKSLLRYRKYTYQDERKSLLEPGVINILAFTGLKVISWNHVTSFTITASGQVQFSTLYVRDF